LFSKNHHRSKAEAGAGGVTYWIDIISAECVPSSLDPMGTVAKGRLVIRGAGRPALLSHREDFSGRYTRHYTVDRHNACSFSIQSNFTVEGQNANVDYDLIEHGLMKPNSDMSIYCLYIAGMPCTGRSFDVSLGEYTDCLAYMTWALLLHRVDGENCERLGLIVSKHFYSEGVSLLTSLNQSTITII
jgi:hypothetical protein